MNHSKIAAALRALADAFEEGVEAVEQAATGGKKGRKTATPAEGVAPAATTAAAAPAPAPAGAATAAAAQPSLTGEPVSTITKKQVNDMVLAVAAKGRDKAEKILATFGLTNTVGLAPEKFQAVYDAFEEELARINAASVQQAQASLV